MSESWTIPPQMTKARFNNIIDHGLTKTATRIIKVNSSGSYDMLSGTDGTILGTSSTDGIGLVQTAISSISTGNVYVKPGGYGTGSISMADHTVLILDEGAMTFTYTPAAGATCTIVDYEAGKITYYEEGALSAEINMNAGTIYLRESLTAPTITGSTFVSGSKFLGPLATITNINTTNLTGSLISGSNFLGLNATITNITGSTLISGSSIIASHGLVKPYTYIMYSGSNYFWAENGSTGLVDFGGSANAGGVDGTSATNVLQSAVNASLHGGVVFVKPGIYPITASIDCKLTRGTTIQGSGRGGYPPHYISESTLFLKQFDGTLFDFEYTADDADLSFTLKDFAVQQVTGSTTGYAVSVKLGYGWVIDNVFIWGTEGGISASGSRYHRLQNVGIAMNKHYGILYNGCFNWQWYYMELDDWGYQDANYAAVKMTDSTGEIIGGHFEGWRGLNITNGILSLNSVFFTWSEQNMIYLNSSNTRMVNCHIQNANSLPWSDPSVQSKSGSDGAAIYLVQGYLHLIGCTEESISATYSIYGEAGSNLNNIVGCHFRNPVVFSGSAQTIIGNSFDDNLQIGANTVVTGNQLVSLTQTSTGNKIRDNPGFVSENWGASSGSGAQLAIAHGCDFTPSLDQLYLSERGTGGALAYGSSAPDSGSIYVTATANKSFNWRVSMNP